MDYNYLIDTHSHLDGEEFLDDFEEVIKRAQESQIKKIFIPNINVANPINIKETFLFLSDLQAISIITPIIISTGVNEVGLNIFSQNVSPLIPPKLSIHAVTVVPIFAPIITPMDCLSVIIPELTKPTTITVVAEEL